MYLCIVPNGCQMDVKEHLGKEPEPNVFTTNLPTNIIPTKTA